LLPGRICESNYECLSFNCTAGTCKGASSGTSCAAHEECDIGLGCIPLSSWPYTTTCNALSGSGNTCTTHYDCDTASLCWYATRADFYSATKTCIAMFSLNETATFGWAPIYYDDIKDSLWHGQLCTTGIAFPVYDSSDPRPQA
jgi:hypothetical protein